MEVLVSLLLLVAGFVLLIKGADWFVDGACALAHRLGISQLVIGLTIVAMGTSAPEAAVSITAALKGNADITVGNIVGSNILNILIILGISAAITPLMVSKSTIWREIPFLLFCTALLFVLGMNENIGLWEGEIPFLLFCVVSPFVQGVDGSIVLWEGAVMLVIFAAYLAYLLITAKRGGDVQEGPGKEMGLLRAVVSVAVGLAIVIGGSVLAVEGATTMARIFGMSERLIGLTIVALGTSLPELVTSVSAARKGNADIAIGNIVGSNIFNILFVIGLSSLITKVPFSSAFYVDTAVALISTVLLFLCCVRKKRLGRASGVVLLAGYVAYFIVICM